MAYVPGQVPAPNSIDDIYQYLSEELTKISDAVMVQGERITANESGISDNAAEIVRVEGEIPEASTPTTEIEEYSASNANTWTLNADPTTRVSITDVASAGKYFVIGSFDLVYESSTGTQAAANAVIATNETGSGKLVTTDPRVRGTGVRYDFEQSLYTIYDHPADGALSLYFRFDTGGAGTVQVRRVVLRAFRWKISTD